MPVALLVVGLRLVALSRLVPRLPQYYLVSLHRQRVGGALFGDGGWAGGGCG